MNLKENLKQRLTNWIVEGGSVAEYDNLVREIYAAGLSPIQVFDSAREDINKTRKENHFLQEIEIE